MMKLYDNNPMNQPRLATDRLFGDGIESVRYSGPIADAMNFVTEAQLKSTAHWRRFVNQFKMEDADFDGGWRGEYWGKMMRGAAFVYAYSRDPELYNVLCETVRDMMSAAREFEGGRISSYGRDHEFCHWDIWARKYVLLGMQYFYEVCDDEALRSELVDSMCRQADCIIAGIGKEDGKKRITLASHHWRGLNSSSLLEPIVRLYSLTGEQKYLDFATYIVEEGGTDVVNVFRLAYENQLKLYQYPVTKAYEMTSCFEGLLEYYRITHEEWYREAIIRYADRILEDDFTVIGSAGCTHELFDHSTVRQANTTNDPVMQETCVTVTLMKFFYQLHLLTGEAKYADAFEIALYNAYLGSLNTEGGLNLDVLSRHPEYVPEALPFDSYSPLTAGTRGLRIGGYKPMSDNTYYGCCACIGAAGIGLVPKMQTLLSEDGATLNLYIDGNVNFSLQNGTKISIKIETDYPKTGDVKITLGMQKPEKFALSLRIPAWSRDTSLTINGTPCEVSNGYTTLSREFYDGDVIVLSLDMSTEIIRPIPYGEQVLMNEVVWGANMLIPTYDAEDPMAKHHVALRRGPVMLAQDERLGYSTDTPITVTDKNGFADVTLTENHVYPAILTVEASLEGGKTITLTDYASAGKVWNNGKRVAVWMLTD